MDGKKKHLFILNWCQKQATIQNSKKKQPQHNFKIQRASLLFVVVNIDLMCSLV